jgi:hypothetical protein
VERRTRVWLDRGGLSPFPELEFDDIAGRANSAVCFSGGGMRAVAATYGQLRGLRALGLLGRTRYLSCVSGGARAGTVFAYYRRGPANDEALLGTPVPPHQLSFSELNRLERHSLGSLATRDPTVTMFLLAAEGVAGDRLWIDAAGLEYLAPFGLHDPNDPAYFSYDEDSVAAIRRRNPHLADVTFHVLRASEPRPYPILQTVFICPRSQSPVREYRLVNCEVTPLYVGTPHPLTVRYEPVAGKPVEVAVGGGSVEPFAFGAARLEFVHDGTASVSEPERPFTLADVVGTATASYAVDDHNFFGSLSPRRPYWSPAARPPTAGTAFNFGDAGYLEDYGLISVLLRNVRSAVVFINTGTRLNPNYDPATPPGPDDIDAHLPPLFGYPNPFSPYNQVFERSAFSAVVRDLQQARSEGRTVLAVSDLITVANAWWGLAGGFQVRVLWVYNERVPAWERLIPADTGIPAAIRAGNEEVPRGPFTSFPNYAITGQSEPGSLALTPMQINLLANLSCWNVTENAARFRDSLTAR